MSTRRRVAVYDRYWSTLGGGETVAAAFGQVIAAEDHDVTLLGPAPVDTDALLERLGFDVRNCDMRIVVDDTAASAASAEYDVFVNATYRSTARNQAPLGYYYVHFPGEVRGRADRWRSQAGDALLGVLERFDDPPSVLGRVRTHLRQRVVVLPPAEAIRSYQRIVANSEFTAEWCRRFWGVESDVLYPPVRPGAGPGVKENLIVTIGRFFDPESGHSKKQLAMVEKFHEISADLPGWRLAVVGGCDAPHREYALRVKRAALGLPVHVHVNASGHRVESLLASASLFWHATGLDEDPWAHPDRLEHFGIVVVEAMAAAAVPIVFGAAGPREIVRDGIDGAHFASLEQLADTTRLLASDRDRRKQMAAQARIRAQDFSAAAFAERLRRMLNTDGVAASTKRP